MLAQHQVSGDYPTHVSGTPAFLLNFQALESAGCTETIRDVVKLRDEIIQFDGYPPGSFNIYDRIMKIRGEEWQDPLAALGIDARAALEKLTRQRVHGSEQTSIIYTVESEIDYRRIVMGGITSPDLQTYWYQGDKKN